MPEIQAHETGADIRGVYTIADIDKWNLARIDNAKTTYLMNLSTFNEQEAGDQLENLLSTMLTIMEKYFPRDKIMNRTIHIGAVDLNFYELRREVSNIKQRKNLSNKKEYYKTIAESAFSIYNSYVKALGLELPTTKIKKKGS
jgi:hypothetical protein